SRSPAAGRNWRSPSCSHSRRPKEASRRRSRPKEASRRSGPWPCYRLGSTRCGGLASQEEGYGLFVPASPACTATLPPVASASVQKVWGVRERLRIRRDEEDLSPGGQFSTGLDESVTSLLVLSANEQQHVALASLVDARDPIAQSSVRSRLVTG